MKAKLDAKEVMEHYSAALRRLSKLTGFSQKTVLRSEAGVILKTWAGRTPVATEPKADKRSRVALGRKFGTNNASDVGDVSINAGARGPVGRVWRRVKKPGRHFLLIGQLTSNLKSVRWGKTRSGNWGQYTKPVTAVLNWLDNWPSYQERGRRSMGMALQSIVQIADDLGIDLMAVKGGGNLSSRRVALARAALASNNRSYKNGTGTEGIEEKKEYIDLINNLPYGTKIGMDRRLLSIVSGRAKFFEQSYMHGAFDSIRNTTRAFPQLMSFSEAA